MSHLLFGIVIPNIFETIPKERGNGKNKLKLLSLRGLGVSPVIKLFLTKRTVFVGPKTLLLALFGFPAQCPESAAIREGRRGADK